MKLCVDGGACADLTRNQFDAATASSESSGELDGFVDDVDGDDDDEDDDYAMVTDEEGEILDLERKTPALLELSEQLERLGMAHTRDPKAATRRNRARADLHRRQAADAARRHAKAKHKAAK